MIVEVHAIVSGRVQGVGFRATVRHHALRLGIRGTVKNLADGTVEIYAQAEEQQLDNLFHAIRTDIGDEYIRSIKSEFVSPMHRFNQFSIIY